MQKDVKKHWIKSENDNEVVNSGRHEGFQFKTSNLLATSIASKRNSNMLDLFFASEQEEEQAEIVFRNNKGKDIALTPLQIKTTLGLAKILDRELGSNEDFENYVASLPDKYRRIEAMAMSDTPYSGMSSTTYSIWIDVLEFTKLVCGKKGGQQLASIREELYNLANTYQLLKMGNYTYPKPLITIKGGIITPTTKKIEIELSDVFIYGMHRQYIQAPLNLLQLVNKQGDNTELTSTLLIHLMSIRGNYVSKAKEEVAKAKKELRKKKLTPEKMTKELEAVGREALTYKEGMIKVIGRLPSDDVFYREEQGRRRLRKDQWEKRINKTTQSLIGIGIITELYITSGADGCPLLNFVFNPNWIAEEKRVLQGLPEAVTVSE